MCALVCKSILCPSRRLSPSRPRTAGYDFTILCGPTGDVLVRGGLFPEETSARLLGSSFGGSMLKLRGIYIGFRMELSACNRSIITSHVRSIRLVSGVPEAPVGCFPEEPSAPLVQSIHGRSANGSGS